MHRAMIYQLCVITCDILLFIICKCDVQGLEIVLVEVLSFFLKIFKFV